MSDPRLVPIYGVTSDATNVSILMEFVRDPTLTAWQSKPGQTLEEVLAAYIAAGEGLAALHKKGLLHRNFKPTNVFVEPAKAGRNKRNVRVAGFGMQRDGAPYVGNPYYASPEHCNGRPLTDKSDQFSFCIALHHALFADHPFLVPANNSIRMADCWDDPPNPSNARVAFFVTALQRALLSGRLIRPPNIPRDLLRVYRIITRGIRREPGERHESMDKLLARLKTTLFLRRLRPAAIFLSLALAPLIAAILVFRQWNPVAPSGPDAVTASLNAIGQMSLDDRSRSRSRQALEHCQARLTALRASFAASSAGDPPTIELIHSSDRCLIEITEP